MEDYILRIQSHLIRQHASLLDWFTCPAEWLLHRPSGGGWTGVEILEHVALTSHYLLILIDKGSDKALRNVRQLDLQDLLANFVDGLDRMEEIGMRGAFPWIRPEHMEPTGEKAFPEIKSELIEQLRRCLDYLDRLKGGEGLRYTTTMTVNGLGKLNVYEYIYFLSLHIQRHRQQLENNCLDYQRQFS